MTKNHRKAVQSEIKVVYLQRDYSAYDKDVTTYKHYGIQCD